MATYSQNDLVKALQQSAQIIQSLEARLKGYDEPIAIIGMGCRFPQGADSPEKFWHLLRSGVDAVGEVPPERWDMDAYYDPDPQAPNKTATRCASFLADVAGFDAPFFGISPREATSMDPQQRLLLEVSWEALEAAGIAPATLFKSETGVFLGLVGSDYGMLMVEQSATFRASPEQETQGIYGTTGSALSIAAGRLAYTLGLMGPAMVVDTACSSSLVAIHLACQSLRQQECTLALAGGANLILWPQAMVELSKAKMLSADGRCKSFAASADGYGRGEGCGIVVLKRLSDAVRAGDNILAVIRGSAINQDGRSSGLTAPNGPAQQAVIQQALKRSKVEPQQISYIEAHGTGTPLGDPIETGAITSVFAQRTTPLWLGSAKSNIGHTEATAGVAGLMKLVLALQHGEIPPSLHFETPNPYIDWELAPFQIPTQVTAWPAGRRIGGVSSFGMSGTNAHMIVEAWSQTEPPNLKPETLNPEAHLLSLSAKSEAALRQLAEKYADFLQTRPAVDLADLCYTANTGRNHFAHRVGIVAQNTSDLQAQLAAFSTGVLQSGVSQGHHSSHQPQPSIAFLFTGQGSQYLNMGRELYQSEAHFRQTLQQCDAILQPLLGESILALLYPDAGVSDLVQKSKIDDTTFTQPLLFALEYALASLWRTWGIEPSYLMGHSVGEYVAACIAGVFSLEDGLKLITARGRLMGALPQEGAMVALRADEATVQQLIAPYVDKVAIAAVNGHDNIVISGQRDAIQQIVALFQAGNYPALETRILENADQCRMDNEAALSQIQNQKSKVVNLNVSHAFHSPLMEPILAEFEQVARSISYALPQIPLVSNRNGQLVESEVTQPSYWVRHLRDCVRFADGISTLLQQKVDCFLEIGPKPTLLGLTRSIYDAQTPTKPQQTPILLPSLRSNQPDIQTMLGSLARLYTSGLNIDWQRVDPASPRRKLVLPTYAFQRQPYWIDYTPQQRTQTDHAAGTMNRQNGQSPMLVTPVLKKFRQQVEGLSVAAQQEALSLYIEHEVARAMGVTNPAQLDREERFLELGMDSLTAYELRSRLQTHLECSLPSTLIFDQPTTTTLTRYLAEIVLKEPIGVQVASSPRPSTLVPLQPRGSRPPLFMVSGILGSAFDFQQLAQQLGSEQPFYALRSLGIDEDHQPLTAVAAIAAHHIRSLQAVQPSGPYQLGGYSFGGKIAYEMAQQLQQQGHEIALLAILDTPSAILGESQHAATWDDAQFVWSLAELYGTFSEASAETSEQNSLLPCATTLEFVRTLDCAEQMRFLQAAIQQAGIVFSELETKRALQVYKANLLAYSRYNLQPTCPLPVTLLQAAERIQFDMLPTKAMTLQDPSWGWQKFSTAAFDLQIIPGNHISMVGKPYVVRLAEILSKKLN